MLDQLFSPMKIGTCEIKNRLVVPAMVVDYNTEDGFITEKYLKYMEEKARGGWGLIITEDFMVQEGRKGYNYIAGMWDDKFIEGATELTRRVHAQGSKIFCQMYHPGYQVTPLTAAGIGAVAPSNTKSPACQVPAREMTVDEIHQLVADFGQAARRARESGFDGVEIHGAHGYLLAEFLSPAVNRRVDEYGGCFENRVRIVDEIIASIREQVGPDYPVQIRISTKDFVEGGRTEAETYELAAHLEEVGFDAIHASNGMYQSAPREAIIAPMFADHALNMDRAEQIKRAVSIPVILANRVNDPRMADTLIKMGKADFVAMGRGSLADPDLPNKAREGKLDSIRYCIGCVQGCSGGIMAETGAECLVNPRIGHELEGELEPVAEPRRVMVVGGGPAGLIAAETAAKRGHKVELYEAQGELGGQFRAAAYPVGKGELATFVSQLRRSLDELSVPVHLNTEVTGELIESEAPDAIILATGAKPLMPRIPGIERAVTAEDVLLGNVDVPWGPVVVCGGGEVGCETANFIASTNMMAPVTVLEMQDQVLTDMSFATKMCLMEMLQRSRVDIRTGATVSRVEEDGVVYVDASGSEVTVPAATVVSAFGYKAFNPLEEAARARCDDVQVVGCAVKAGNALVATREGYAAGLAV